MDKLHKIFQLALLISFTCVEPALPSDELITASYSHTKTNSDFLSDHLLFSNYNEKTETKDILIFSLDADIAKGKVGDVDFSSQKIGSTVYYSAETLNVIFRPSLISRKAENADTEQKLFGSVLLEFKPSASILRLELGRAYMAETLQSTASMQGYLRSNYYMLSAQHRVADSWRVLGFVKNNYLNDGNIKLNSDISLMYGISPSWPWIWLGVGGEWIKNSKPNQPYWTPREFYSYGPRLDIAAPINDRFSYAFGFNINRFKDIDFGLGSGYYFNSKLIYQKKDTSKYELRLESIESKQNGNSWKSLMLGLGYICPF